MCAPLAIDDEVAGRTRAAGQYEPRVDFALSDAAVGVHVHGTGEQLALAAATHAARARAGQAHTGSVGGRQYISIRRTRDAAAHAAELNRELLHRRGRGRGGARWG